MSPRTSHPATADQTTSSALAERAYLHVHGIRLQPAGFSPLLVAAVEALPSTLYGESASELTAGESEVLEAGGLDLAQRELGTEDPVARATAEYYALLESALTSGETAARLGVDASRVRQRLGERTLYGLRIGAHWRLPAFQFADAGEVPGLAIVLPGLDPELHPLSVARWFVAPDPDLEDESSGRALSPREWLRLGRSPQAVARRARQL